LAERTQRLLTPWDCKSRYSKPASAEIGDAAGLVEAHHGSCPDRPPEPKDVGSAPPALSR
jgi:hypothetical protein